MNFILASDFKAHPKFTNQSNPAQSDKSTNMNQIHNISFQTEEESVSSGTVSACVSALFKFMGAVRLLQILIPGGVQCRRSPGPDLEVQLSVSSSLDWF